jgi:asparagine synthase (glutamine-hydrolysing)
MCGIAGFVGQRWVAVETQQRMLDALAPRGPDASRRQAWTAQFQSAPERAQAALLHTRLSIRDLRAVAHQPMASAAGDVWICFNGEVYGWEAEAEELKRRGYAFNTTSDTEFILHGYCEWGLELLPKLRGKFALALLDLRQRKLFLVRDRLGIKPLVYFHRPGEIVFGSTVRSVLPYLAPTERQLSAPAIDAYLAHRYVPAPRTIFENIRRLAHGHYACFDIERGTLDMQHYWQPQPEARDVAETLIESVTLRTVSDRPVGLFLSGGIDSTTVASVLAQSGHREITAYTAAFPGTEFDESAQAALIARRLGLKHVVLPIEQQIGQDFERIVADLDEPFADPSSFPLWYIARAASSQVKVVLGGDGGDELFAGYKRYDKHLRHAWRGERKLPRRERAPDSLPRRKAKLLDELGLGWLAAYSLRFSGMHPSLRRYLQPEFECRSEGYWDMMPRDPLPTPLEALLEIDMHNYLPEYILRKGDLCTMAHGLELRVPLLDHRFYQTVTALSPTRRFTEPRKLALGEVCGLCTELGLFAQKKRGFNPPLAGWLRGELRARLDWLGHRLHEASGEQLDGMHIDQLVAAFLGGRDEFAEQVLQLLVLDVSLQQLTTHGAHRLH